MRNFAREVVPISTSPPPRIFDEKFIVRIRVFLYD